MMRTEFWQHLTSTDFAGLDAEATIVLLPVSAVEQHGPHLPLATDALIGEALVAAVMSRVEQGLLVLPAMSIGHSLEHIDFAGTLSISAESLLATWIDIGRSVARAGLRKLVLLNTHGGNMPLVQLAALRLRQECGLLVVRANHAAFGSPPGMFAQDELRHGFHGGEMETSLMLHIQPGLVRRAALSDFNALTHAMAASNQWLGAEKPIGFGWMSQDIHSQGVCGNASLADAQRGEALLTWLADQLALLIGEVKATRLTTLQVRQR